MMTRPIIVVLSLLILIVSSYTYGNDKTHIVLENGQLLVFGEPLPLPGQVENFIQDKQDVYVAVGNFGVFHFQIINDHEVKLIEKFATTGKAVDFLVRKGRLWVELLEQRAIPLVSLSPAASITEEYATVQEVSVMHKTQTGIPHDEDDAIGKYKVIAVRPGELEINAGSEDGVSIGQRIFVYHEQSASETSSTFIGRKLTAIATVTALKKKQALAALGRGMWAQERDTVSVASKEEEVSIAFPNKFYDYFEVYGQLKPYIAIGRLGVGGVADVSFEYVAKNYFLKASLSPFAIAGDSDGMQVSTNLFMEAGFDTRFFAIGLGFGDSARTLAKQTNSSNMINITDTVFVGRFSVTQQARLGARDGLHIDFHNYFILDEQTNALDEKQYEFSYGGASGRLVIPIGVLTDLYAEGGYGSVGYGFGGAGIQTWLIGNGGPGSIAASVSAGYAAVIGRRNVHYDYGIDYYDEGYYEDDVTIGGPMVSFGLRYRFY